VDNCDDASYQKTLDCQSSCLRLVPDVGIGERIQALRLERVSGRGLPVEGTIAVEMASAFKVAYHQKKLAAYLNGERIVPACLELDLSTECNRSCSLCPSTTGGSVHRLGLDFITRLLADLAGETRGLLLSGGEPTMAETFTEALRIARKNGFLEIAVVSNGDFLSEDSVAEALLRDATTVRVSLYDWSHADPTELRDALCRIEKLRKRIESTGSRLQIGIGALTTAENALRIPEVVRAVASAGAHWIYFHPMCVRWAEGTPQRVDQSGVWEAIDGFRASNADGFGIFSFADRYGEHDIRFDGYHAAHFLLVVGADGMNYLGAEVKYQPMHILADLNEPWNENFLWGDKRLARVAAVRSKTYPALASRHRGVLYNHVIQGWLDDEKLSTGHERQGEMAFLYPHIL
jgi:organic radical activating enzyme